MSSGNTLLINVIFTCVSEGSDYRASWMPLRRPAMWLLRLAMLFELNGEVWARNPVLI